MSESAQDPPDPSRDLPYRFSRVLVVDDEDAMRHMLELVLRREELDVLSADSGEAAIERLHAGTSVDAVPVRRSHARHGWIGVC